MKLLPITSNSLFKGTVALLAVPAVLLPVVIILFGLIGLISSPPGGGIGSFGFGVTRLELIMIGAMVLGAFLLVGVLVWALVRRHIRGKSGISH